MMKHFVVLLNLEYVTKSSEKKSILTNINGSGIMMRIVSTHGLGGFFFFNGVISVKYIVLPAQRFECICTAYKETPLSGFYHYSDVILTVFLQRENRVVSLQSQGLLGHSQMKRIYANWEDRGGIYSYSSSSMAAVGN